MERVWKVMCDGCGTMYPNQFFESIYPDGILEVLRKDGWIRLPNGDTERDLCAECAKKENGVRV